MTQLPDVHCWIKVIDDESGKAQPDGKVFKDRKKVTVRYSIGNDSHQIAGPPTVVGSLYRDNVKVQSNGQSNVVPAQQITLQPGQIWSKEHHLSESLRPGEIHLYTATLRGDDGSWANEEDEKNNRTQMTFSFEEPPH